MSCSASISKGRREGLRSLRLGGFLLAATGSSFGSLPAVAGSLAVAAAVVSVSRSASAQESAEVEAILKRGIQLRRDGQDEAALAVFQEAEAQAPNSVRVLLHVATAAQAASKWLLADEYLKKADSHNNDPYYVRYRAEIDEVRSTTAQRVGHFRAVGDPSGAEVILNGQVVGTLPMENPKTLEAGTYVLEVNKPGFYRLRRPISVPGGVLTRETVELNERTGTGPDPGDGSGAPAEPPSFWASSGMTWTLAGVAAAAGVTSGVSFFLRERAADHWNDNSRCLSSTPVDQNARREELCSSVRNDIDTAEQVGIVSGVVGVAFAGAALTHWLATGGSSEPEVDSTARREHKSTGSVQCSPGLMNVVCSGSF
ncbi:MAG: PEGA domain-containing protein [Deltaproteobacteria bacterium]